MNDNIVIKGARQHNLKNIDLTIPRNKLVVMTGLSGSGKSSLAFDTIYAEGQRRYVESLSAYARQFLGQMEKPDVDYIEGLSPAISIDQKTTSHNPRSTVGTVTEIYDYLRLLFARIGRPYCSKCGRPIQRQTVQQIVDQVLTFPEGAKIVVMAPVVHGRKGSHQKVFEDARAKGFARVYVNGKLYLLDEEDVELTKTKKHNISLVIDRLAVRSSAASRLTDSVEAALKLANGLVEIALVAGDKLQIQLFSENFACSECGISVPELEPRLFSFNNPYGACPVCTGLGMQMEFDQRLIIPDHDRSFASGAIAALSANQEAYHMRKLDAMLRSRGYSLDCNYHNLDQATKDILWQGSGQVRYKFWYENLQGEVKEHQAPFEGLLSLLKRRHREAFSERMRLELEEFMTSTPCPACHGARLRPEVLAIKIGGLSISQLSGLSVVGAIEFCQQLSLTGREQLIAEQVLKEIVGRLRFLRDVGLEYLTLDRTAGTLSGGEAQRIRLATQIGSGLTGVLYILDEPSIGLHQRDNGRLLATLKQLRDLGNTLIVVEHDEETMWAADQIIDIGPGAGEHGGEVIAQGTAKEIGKIDASVTGRYLSGKEAIAVPKHRRAALDGYLEIVEAQANNLKNITVQIPIGLLTVVTGVSGSGKSTLVNEILYNALAAKLNGARVRAAKHTAIFGAEYLDKVINIDQAPIGRTPRSNPATYTGVFDLIRTLFSQTSEAKARGYLPGRFSFNVKGGRCEACLGDGVNKIEMNFLPDIYVPCEVCHGARYNRDTLEVYYKGKNIAEVLAMTVSEACQFMANMPRIARKLQVLEDVGLGYIRLGQAATTLSGGEAQRVKLATELSRAATGKTLYILDEPTTGLHAADVHKLLGVLHRLVDKGNTVVVIEHNLDVIKTADYIIDLGPEGGEGGGQVVAEGTPEEVASNAKSYTGAYLAKILNGQSIAKVFGGRGGMTVQRSAKRKPVKG